MVRKQWSSVGALSVRGRGKLERDTEVMQSRVGEERKLSRLARVTDANLVKCERKEERTTRMMMMKERKDIADWVKGANGAR